MGVSCWDCQDHQRMLIKTELNRPLCYASVCQRSGQIHPLPCPHFQLDSPSSGCVTEERGLCLSTALEQLPP